MDSNTAEDFQRNKAITNLNGKRVYADDRISRSVTLASPSLVVSHMSWASVFGGLTIALSVQITLFMLTLSFGMYLLGPESPGSVPTISWTTAIIHIVTLGISLFVGAFTAARLSNIPRHQMGMGHGLIVWGISVIFNMLLMGQLFSGIGSGISNALSQFRDINVDFSLENVIPENMQSDFRKYNLTFSELRDEAQQIIEESEIKAIGNNALRSILLTPGDAGQDFEKMVDDIVSKTKETWSRISEEDIANVIANRTDLSQSESLVVAKRWKGQIDRSIANFKGKIQETKQNIMRESDQAMDFIGNIALFTFFALLIGAAIALLGGFVGTPKEAVTIE